jgi:hypothetical protein
MFAMVEIISPVRAQTAVLEVASVAALHADNIDSSNSVHLASYYCLSSPSCQPDGGEGLLVQGSGTCKYQGQSGLGTLEDGGSFFADAGHHCWYRQNLNGDLRQWGVTSQSVYDVIYEINQGHPEDIADAKPQIDLAFAALLAQPVVSSGSVTIHTHGVSIKIGSILKIPAGSSFTCDAPPVKNAANANYTSLPGSIVLAHGAYLDAVTNSDVEVHHCAAVIPEWYINPSTTVLMPFGGISFTSPPTAYADLEAIRANMILASDVGIEAGAGAYIHDLSILGFDNCLYSSGGQDMLAKNLAMDCPIPAYLAKNRGAQTVKDLSTTPLLTKQTKVSSNEEYWTITDVQANSSGGCRLTLADVGFDLADIQNSITDDTLAYNGRGDPVSFPAWVTGLGGFASSCLSAGTGRFGNDAAWAVQTVAGMTDEFDLVGSKYTSTSTSVDTTADWNANTGIIRITGSISSIAIGMKVTSSDASWPATGATVTGIVTRATGPDPNDGYNGYVVVSPPPAAASSGNTIHFFSKSDTIPAGPCNGTGATPCFFYNAAERYVAGNSDAGNSSARLPASRGGHLAAGVLIDGVSGIKGVNADTYGHYYNVAAIDSEECDFTMIKGDDNGELNPGNDVGIYSTGDSRGCVFDSEGPGKPAAALVLDTFGTTDYGGTDSGAEPQTARTTIDQSFPQDVTVDSMGTVNWPARGTMHICTAFTGTNPKICNPGPVHPDEIVSYHVKDDHTFTIDVRGRFGTVPQDFTGFTATLFSTSVNNGGKKPDKSGTTVFQNLGVGTTIGVGNAFEIQHGAAILTGIRTPASGIGFVSTNTSGVAIASTNEPATSIVFEDENARILTTVSPDSQFGSYSKQGALNMPLSYYQWFGSPQSATGLTDLGIGGAGSLHPLSVQDTTNWPPTGILIAGSEYMAYHVQDATTLVVDQRALCGSAAAAHADATMISHIAVLYGCPQVNEGLPQFMMDGAGNVTFAQSALAHGQVYMSYDATNTLVKLCPQNGKGLINNGSLRAVPHGCTIASPGTLTASTLYYVYAVYHLIPITDMAIDSGHPRLKMPNSFGLNDFVNGVPVTCSGFTGTHTMVANVSEDPSTLKGTVGSFNYITLTDQSISTIDTPGNTGACSYIGLQLKTDGHATAPNGVEVRYDSSTSTIDPTSTLVGMVYADTTSTLHDSATQRDVASWFNRRFKTCSANWALGNGAVTSTTYAELKSSSIALHCHFVTWGDNDTAWNLPGAVNDSAANETAFLAAGFDTTSSPTLETTQWQESVLTQRFPLGLTGSTSLSEGPHYITTLGKAPTGTVTVYSGGREVVRLLQ